MSDVEPTPNLATVLGKAFAAHARWMRVALPGRVESYDASTQTCSVQPLVQDGVNDETGTRNAVRLPVVQSVPVAWLGGGGCSITSPLAAGDTVLLVFSSSSIDRWVALGGEVDPIDDRRHHITDAFAIPCVNDLQHVLGSDAVDGTALVVKAPTVKLGSSSAADPPALNVDLAAVIAAIVACTPAELETGLAGLKAAIISAFPSPPTGATKVLVE
ncbi:MAG TPA: Gp138 family membrane-puncturing spike protein [Kofleriaceae bacterium]